MGLLLVAVRHFRILVVRAQQRSTERTAKGPLGGDSGVDRTAGGDGTGVGHGPGREAGIVVVHERVENSVTTADDQSTALKGLPSKPDSRREIIMIPLDQGIIGAITN